MIEIDGSQGEGGGQVLRSSLALSLLTGKSLKIINIRANRSNPGLQAQHLSSVQAAAKVGRAELAGADLKSTRLVFKPKGIYPGRFQFEIGTAGSTSLVLQTIYFPLSQAKVASNVVIAGGTHVPNSPSYQYLAMHWLHFMQRLGFNSDLSLIQAGFYPQGGGEIQATIRPLKGLSALRLNQRGSLQRIRGVSVVANLDRKIAERQRIKVVHRIGAQYPLSDLRIQQMPSRFKGTMLLLLAEFEHSQASFFSLGALGKPAEKVADEVVDDLLDFLASDGAIDLYLADQLLLPLSLADQPSYFTTSKMTRHLTTNAEIIERFLPVKIKINQSSEKLVYVSVDF